MKKLFKSTTAALCLLAAVNSASAQSESVNIDTKFDSPEKIPLHLSAYGYYNGEFNGGGHVYLGLSGAVLLGKHFLIQSNVGLLPKSVVDLNTNGYSNLKQVFVADGRFTFRFSDKMRDNKETKKWKSGMYEYTLNFTRKERVTHGVHVLGHMSTVTVTQSTSKDSIFRIQENGADVPMRDLTINQTMMVIGGGYNFLTITNFKGRVSQVGKTIRSRKFVNFYIEAMFAPVIKLSEEVKFMDPQTNVSHNYKVVDPDKVRLGFRMVADVNKGRPGIYWRFEMGRKTGMAIPHEQKWLTNAFMGFGLGLGW